eukprot:m.98851 g.98851  ORF g.98851 m.98851 type:complete len:192 (+) comp12445_c0_seq5:984-1559(+)
MHQSALGASARFSTDNWATQRDIACDGDRQTISPLLALCTVTLTLPLDSFFGAFSVYCDTPTRRVWDDNGGDGFKIGDWSVRGLLTKNVTLESVTVNVDNDQRVDVGILVRNITYAKAVSVRFTTDQWSHVTEVGAVYTDHLSDQHDRFVAIVDRDSQIEFALVMRCNGEEHWDNNDFMNYSLAAELSKTS